LFLHIEKAQWSGIGSAPAICRPALRRSSKRHDKIGAIGATPSMAGGMFAIAEI
jgi:hypothetical protein